MPLWKRGGGSELVDAVALAVERAKEIALQHPAA